MGKFVYIQMLVQLIRLLKESCIPTLNSIIEEIHGQKVFAKLDIREAYTQIELEEESNKNINFNTHDGFY